MRSSLKLSMLLAMGCLMVLAYLMITRQSSMPQQAAHDLASTKMLNPFNRHASSSQPSIDTASSTSAITTSPPQTYPADIVAQWIESGVDSTQRAAELDALTMASRAQAVPVLQRVLIAGDDAERQHAVNSLHTLALRQGDADGAIREVLRQAVFHDDGAFIADDVQAALADIEQKLKQPLAR